MALEAVEASHEIEAVVGGYHGDAFRILGPHQLTSGKSGEERWTVRAFLPHADSVELVIGTQAVPMDKRHAHGFFVINLETEPLNYRFRVHLWSGVVETVDDPYRFGPLLSDFDLYLHAEGTHFESYNTLGAHIVEAEGARGVRFALWAPNAEVVCVVGDFNHWDTRRHPMRMRTSGVWELFIPDLGAGATYKYFVRSRNLGYRQLKSDPYGFGSEVPPKSASVVADLNSYEWNDSEWMESRAARNWLKEPIAIYEVHLESWMRKPNGESLSYRELAHTLVEYVKRNGFTHIELLPVMEHPFSGSWGYQVVGYYAPTSRFGSPEDFMYFVDECHRNNIGVLVDWVPAHFPRDSHGLAFFDGTALYEHADPRKGEHREWGTLIFNFGRNEVRTFLISNAVFWLKQYHIDGLRVDAVASMLYLDYSRKAGEWVPNIYGGNENLEAISFIRKFNEIAHSIPGAITIAEESTAFPGVSKPTYLNGLGFTMKWNMGWMHDMLGYFGKEPVHRKFHHGDITFSLLYAFNENFVLPISHDEVVYGKKSLLGRMPGDEWQRLANARAFVAYMWAHPGKKLLFMGCEIGSPWEWNHDMSVPWDLLQYDPHRKFQAMVRELNRIYQKYPAMHQVDFHYSGFEWVDFRDSDGSVIAFLRRAEDATDYILFCCNFTPTPRIEYRFGVADPGAYEEIFNSDAEIFGGSNLGNGGRVVSTPEPQHGRANSIAVTLPPLAVVAFRHRS
ncbi:MAG: 1,4-alpha-glucan branching protein GlgB [Bryobacteraceae bacterium]|nr:1,4-alpha-glucan branching protein GlgB [Bryobacteraceae bacterium]